MIQIKNSFLIILLSSFISFSCNSSYSEDRDIFDKAESFLEVHPDSTLQLLDSIRRPKDVGEDFYNHFVLTKIQAKHRCHENISKDLLIFDVKDYFISKNDMNNAALAALYSGLVLDGRRANRAALLAYLEAQRYAEHTDNSYLKGQIHYYMGNGYLKESLVEESILELKKAIYYFGLQDKYNDEISAYNKLGAAFIFCNKNDSALVYYNKGLGLAETHKNKLLQKQVLQHIGHAYVEIEEYDKARQHFYQAMPLNDKVDEIYNYSGLFKSFSKEGNRDSTMHYIEKAKAIDPEMKTDQLKLNIARALYELEDNNHNYKKALDYHREFTKLLPIQYNSINRESLLELAKKDEQVKNESSQSKIELRIIKIATTILFIILILIAIFFYTRYNKIKSKQSSLKKEVNQAKLLADSYNRKNISMKNVVLEHFNVLKETALIEAYMREEDRKQGQRILKKFHETVYGQGSFDWDKIYATLNHLYDDIVDKMRNKHEDLDESEFKIACLTYADLNNTEISIIMGFKLNTIQAKKYRIRQKLGIQGYGNIIEYLKDNLELDH